jgi:hypothetical protein
MKGQKSGFSPFLMLLLGHKMHILATRGKTIHFVICYLFFKFFTFIW